MEEKKRPVRMSAYYTTIEAAEKLGVHPTTVRIWARKGLIPAAYKGGDGPHNAYLFLRRDIEKLFRKFAICKVSGKQLKQDLAKKTHNNMK